MLDKHMDDYDQDEKGAKAKVSAYIVHLVKEEGSRFLKELEFGGWVEIDEASARAKVSHTFHGQRRLLKAMSTSLLPAKFCESPAPHYVIYDPLPNNILLGRGKPIQDRPGNVRFREMIDKNIDKYDKGEHGAKVLVSAYIVRILKEEGVRFLKELKDGGWAEVDEATALAKVGHAFRTQRRVFQATLKKDESPV